MQKAGLSFVRISTEALGADRSLATVPILPVLTVSRIRLVLPTGIRSFLAWGSDLFDHVDPIGKVMVPKPAFTRGGLPCAMPHFWLAS
jgi:hypothetical protein